MRRKRVWRYYCEHCKKGGCSAGHMKKHESRCTMNPERFCGICKVAGLDQKPIADLIKALGRGDKEGLENLSNLCEACPACILAAIRQSGLQRPATPDDSGRLVDYNFRNEMKYFWQQLRDDQEGVNRW